MISKNLSQAIILSLGLAAAGHGLAQEGTMPDSSPGASNLATKPGQSPSETPTQSLGDAQITTILLAANEAEVRQGKHAQKAAKSKDVKDFAKMMVTEHSQAIKDVKALDAKLKIKSQSSAVRDQRETTARASELKLKDKKGAEFDKAYLEDQVALHQTVLDTIDQHLIPSAKADDLRALLTKTRATVASHLDRAKQLQNASASM